jgi:hypothetical protein
MDSAGDFIIASADASGINVKNSKNQSIVVAPSQAIGSYDFDEGGNPNKSASFSISEPTVAINDSGDFVLAWIESKSESIRKKGKDICTNYYGERYCQPSFKVSSTNTSKLVARRYSNTLTPKEINLIVVANVKGSSLFVAEPEVALDADGDFTVAYSSGKGSTSGYSYKNTIAVEKDVFARQFLLNKNKKLVAGAAIKASSKPKVPAKHTLQNSVNSEPSVVVVNESKNAFILTWHNDYEDHYKDYENAQQVCAKYKTVKNYDGYSERVCAAYKMVPADGINNMSVLKAKRYGN